jgi:hypothetical protein
MWVLEDPYGLFAKDDEFSTDDSYLTAWVDEAQLFIDIYDAWEHHSFMCIWHSLPINYFKPRWVSITKLVPSYRL